MSVLGRIHHRFDTNCLPAFLAYDCDRLFQATACGAHEYGASIRRGAFSTAGARWHWWHRAPYEHRRTTHYMQALCMTPAAVNTRSMQRRLVSWLTHLTKAREGGARTSNPHLWLQRSTILAHNKKKKQQPWKFDEQLQQRQSLMMLHPIPNWHWALKHQGCIFENFTTITEKDQFLPITGNEAFNVYIDAAQRSWRQTAHVNRNKLQKSLSLCHRDVVVFSSS